ncbi:hypothetical protein VMCG_00936 [Cytospora schulzeri]|uniref:Uncharacterized protein n=1 Tax=Cytospora schulzeri TaxID=448051 RepID=A0A423X6G0_9PEZI|nr:hypothetical protein VMCG_00936 [Valsa malicola]
MSTPADDHHLVDHNGGIIAALRSVWFYYLACTPCRKVGGRREIRKEAKRDRGIKERLEMEQPGLYRHPNPENTNQYWLEDINMGPSLPKRGPSNRNESQRKLKSAGNTIGTDASTVERGASRASTTGPFNSNEAGGSPTIVADELELRTTMSYSVADSADLEWNRKRYQREDEELWGHQMMHIRAGQRLRDVITKGRDTAGRLFDPKTAREREITEEERYGFYATPRNPPVNDYHPPVVSSRPASRGEFAWMLQPPPPAKVMEGKVPVSRKGSQVSVGSRRTQASHASKEELGLGRLVGEKLVKDKIRKGEKPSQAELTVITGSRDNVRKTRTASTRSSQPSTRSRSNTTGSESSDTIYERRRQRRIAKQKASTGPGSEADDDETDDEDQARPAGHATQRPKLQTIASSGLSSNKSEKTTTMRPQILPTMTEPAQSPSPMASKGPLDDITNTAAQSPAAGTSNKERPAGGSVDSGLALA